MVNGIGNDDRKIHCEFFYNGFTSKPLWLREVSRMPTPTASPTAPDTSTVAVFVPMSNRKYLTPEEEISFRHLVHFLGKYDKYLVVPQSLDIHYPGFELLRFSNNFFGSHEANTRLMLSRKLYSAFGKYKYILEYQLDCLVFSDQLTEWCNLDVDYIGAPWIPCSDSPWVKSPHVGNGGFSLRKVESFLRVLDSKEYWQDPDEYWQRFCSLRSKPIQYLNIPRKYLARLRALNSVRQHLRKNYPKYEDRFWSLEASKYYPGFNIAPVETALRFSFEVAPRLCFDLNHQELPFGCHAWHRYDRAFWEPYLLP
jgi:hypothetical protein